MKIVILSSLAKSLINFRGRLIGDLVEAGHEVIACAPDEDEAVTAALHQIGARFRHTPMARASVSPLRDLRTLAGYCSLLLRERPDIVLAYTQKPIIYGGLAARIMRRPFCAIMSGLGYVFSDAAAHRTSLRRVVSTLYREALREARTIFVFNADDHGCMAEHGILSDDAPVVQVPGSGIDLQHFEYRELPQGPPTFIMIGRLMRDKGIAEFVRAAAVVRETLPDARFRLLAKPEEQNPTGLSTAALQRMRGEGDFEYLPEASDVRPHLGDAHVFVLPSYYREGLPRTLLEALAVGRPVITTNLPGCREPVVPGENGWLVPPKDSEALAEAMIRSVACPERLRRMSRRAREIAQERFDVTKVNQLMFRSMNIAADRPDNIKPEPRRAPAGGM